MNPARGPALLINQHLHPRALSGLRVMTSAIPLRPWSGQKQTPGMELVMCSTAGQGHGDWPLCPAPSSVSTGSGD